jgi:hypothetical protein
MAKFVKAEGKLWVVMGEQDFEPAPQLDVFTSEENAREYLQGIVKEALERDGETTDYAGRTPEECAEEGVADLGYMRVMILEANKVKRDYEFIW